MKEAEDFYLKEIVRCRKKLKNCQAILLILMPVLAVLICLPHLVSPTVYAIAGTVLIVSISAVFVCIFIISSKKDDSWSDYCHAREQDGILTGKDAREFFKNMKRAETEVISPEEVERVKKNADYLKSIYQETPSKTNPS